MKNSLKNVMVQACSAYANTPRASWVQSWPGQIVLACSAIYWTTEVTEVSNNLMLARKIGNIAKYLSY